MLIDEHLDTVLSDNGNTVLIVGTNCSPLLIAIGGEECYLHSILLDTLQELLFCEVC